MISFEVKGKSKREGVKKLNVSTKNSSTIVKIEREKRERKREERRKRTSSCIVINCDYFS